MEKEYESVNIISMEEFIIREKLQLPNNITNWDGSPESHILWDYLEKNAFVPTSWNRNECIVAFPSTSDGYGNKRLTDMLNAILDGVDGRSFPDPLDYQGKPVPPNAPPIERLREMMAGRSKLCLYTEEMEKMPIIHIRTKPPNERLLTNFYSYVYFEDWIQATWTSRLVRDHLRYKDEIMCAAARVIEALRQSSYSRKNPSGSFHSLHVRRNDFHPNEITSDVSSNDILESLTDIEPGSTLFIATDDYDEDFFQDISETYKLFFLKNFLDLLQGLNPNLYGMIEQVVASRGETFHGMFHSTLSSYINRLRGYYCVRDEVEGSKEGVLKNSYFLQSAYRYENKIYKAVQKPFYSREFPLSWRGINAGIQQVDEATW